MDDRRQTIDDDLAVTPQPSSSMVYRPSSAREAAAILRACTAAGRAVRIRGGGTKSALLPPTDTVISTAELRGISTLALDDLYVTAGASTPLAELQAALAAHGVWVPLVAPSPEATLGGIVATAANAPLRMRYGGVRDLLLAATVALPDGRLIRVGRPVVKNVAGYDLPRLMAGACGTLGLIADVTLKLSPLPRARASLMASVASLDAGLALGASLLKNCLVGSALLLLGNWTLDAGHLTVEGQEISSTVHRPPSFVVYTAEGMAEDVEAELDLARAAMSGADEISPSGSELWAAWLRDSTASDTVVRLGVAPKDLPAALRALSHVLGGKPYIADLANGLLYTRGVAVDQLRASAHRLDGYAVVLSSAAGAPAADLWGSPPQSLELMRALKARWDPAGICNPGAFIV